MARGTKRGTKHSIHRRDAYNKQAPTPTKTQAPKVVRDKFKIARERNKVAYKTGVLTASRPAKYKKTVSTPEKHLETKLGLQVQPNNTRPGSKPKVKRRVDQRLAEKPKENKRCKGRPKTNKGNGTSRKFVPWCQK